MCYGISLRTSTFFLTFLHVFLSVVFLLLCGFETFKFYNPQYANGMLEQISAQIAVRKADLFMLWGYGIIYFVCGVLTFYGVHKELTSLIKWTLVLYSTIELCMLGLLKAIIQKKMSPSTPTDLMDGVLFTFQTSLVVFFIIIHFFHSFPYIIDLVLYYRMLKLSTASVQKIVYV